MSPAKTMAVALATAACVIVGGTASAGDAVEISQKGRRFAPDDVAITAGSKVKILNDDRFMHHVFYEAPGGRFDSGDLRPGNSVELLFAKKGVYNVRCAIHPKMRLEVTVE